MSSVTCSTPTQSWICTTLNVRKQTSDCETIVLNLLSNRETLRSRVDVVQTHNLHEHFSIPTTGLPMIDRTLVVCLNITHSPETDQLLCKIFQDIKKLLECHNADPFPLSFCINQLIQGMNSTDTRQCNTLLKEIEPLQTTYNEYNSKNIKEQCAYISTQLKTMCKQATNHAWEDPQACKSLRQWTSLQKHRIEDMTQQKIGKEIEEDVLSRLKVCALLVNQLEKTCFTQHLEHLLSKAKNIDKKKPSYYANKPFSQETCNKLTHCQNECEQLIQSAARLQPGTPEEQTDKQALMNKIATLQFQITAAKEQQTQRRKAWDATASSSSQSSFLSCPQPCTTLLPMWGYNWDSQGNFGRQMLSPGVR